MPRIDPTQQRGFKTKAKLMRAADQVILLKGRDLFTITEITTRAEVAAGTFFRYWSDKRDLIRDLYPGSTEGLGLPVFLDDEDGNLLPREER